MAETIQLVKASSQHLEMLAPLFDEYRQFYGQPSDVRKAHEFLRERLERNESVVFIAIEVQSGEGVGFTQLYPTFSSISVRRSWILNDLFVRSDYRKQGVAKRLLESAKQHAVTTGAKGLSLSTAITNAAAQILYETFGFTRDDDFYHYDLIV